VKTVEAAEGSVVRGQWSVVRRAPALTAILYNGTLIRALDCNDGFVSGGPSGHPSDNIAVALAFADRQRSTGLEFLRAIALGYELYWRLQRYLPGRQAHDHHWDTVSHSGLVAAAMAGLLLGLDRAGLAAALAIGGAQSYSVAQIRRGEISMLKASADAVVARTGALGALLAAAGMTGPPRLFEGRRGLLNAYALPASDELRQQLVGPIDRWHILDISIKQFPCVITAQGALAALLELVKQHQLHADEIEQVEVRFADLPATREHLAEQHRTVQKTRESADHSIPFLFAVALQDGDIGPAQFAGDRWLDPTTQQLMRRVAQLPDPALNPYTATAHPAVVTITTHDHRTLTREMIHVPGSPDNSLTDADLEAKLRRLAHPTTPPDHLTTLSHRLRNLPLEPDMSPIGTLLTTPLAS
jgi:2-methylcitrate dehydratase